MTIPDIVDVFLIAGQSNASGTGTGYPQRQALFSPEGIIYSSSSPHATIFPPPSGGGELNRLCALANTEGALNNRAHGIELNLAFQYEQYFSKPCIILKETAGATSLLTDWANGSVLRNKLIDRANALTAHLTTLGKTWTIAGFYWNQWEGDLDVASPDPGYYGTLLEAFITDLKANIDGYTDDTMTIACRPSVKNTFSGTITNRRAAITAGDGITNYDWLDQDDLFYIQPAATPVHCDSWSQNVLAERFLTKLYPGITFI